MIGGQPAPCTGARCNNPNRLPHDHPCPDTPLTQCRARGGWRWRRQEGLAVTTVRVKLASVPGIDLFPPGKRKILIERQEPFTEHVVVDLSS